METRNLWIGTFHGLANRILRSHWEQAGLPRDYQILAADEQRQVVKMILRDRKVNPKEFTPGDVSNWIGRVKDEGKRAHHVQVGSTARNRTLREIYEVYDNYCNQNGLVDFAEILLRCHELLLDYDELLEQYQNRFSELLVDEFQDTNVIQYHWIRLLAGREGHVMAVGDDDQSIYGWRGAVVENIREFPNDFQDTKVSRLEQNYRSTANILNAANHLIANNDDRMGKTLWTSAEAGNPIYVFSCDSDRDEAKYVLRIIEDWVIADKDRSFDDVAVLYRSHFQSRPIEAALQVNHIAYTIRGGLRFYERAEIRNAVGYMQLIENRNSDMAFDRVLNVKPRGIGRKSQDVLRDYAGQENLSLWQAARTGIAKDAFPKQLTARLSIFINEIDRLAILCEGGSLEEIADICVNASGLLKYHEESERQEQMRIVRRENLEEFIGACGQFDEQVRSEGINTDERSVLQLFLDAICLDAGDVEEDLGPAVSLMTLHAAKGLEFPLVFIMGMAEGVFPHRRNVYEPVRLLEERRLAYVGLTRAKSELHLTYANSYSSLGGGNTFGSRFIKEIPQEFVNFANVNQPTLASNTNIVSRRQFRRSAGKRWTFD